MTTGEYLRHYAASPLGIGTIAAGLAAGLVAGSAGLGFLPALGLGLGSTVLLGALGLLSGLGSRAAARESERQAELRGRSRLDEASALSERLTRLRLADPEIAAARDLLALEASRILAAHRSGKGARTAEFDPRLAAALSEALELIQAWLREADETAVERRFSAPDQHAFPAAKARVLAALSEKTKTALELRDGYELSGQDLLSADEELR